MNLISLIYFTTLISSGIIAMELTNVKAPALSSKKSLKILRPEAPTNYHRIAVIRAACKRAQTPKSAQAKLNNQLYDSKYIN